MSEIFRGKSKVCRKIPRNELSMVGTMVCLFKSFFLAQIKLALVPLRMFQFEMLVAAPRTCATMTTADRMRDRIGCDNTWSIPGRQRSSSIFSRFAILSLNQLHRERNVPFSSPSLTLDVYKVLIFIAACVAHYFIRSSLSLLVRKCISEMPNFVKKIDWKNCGSKKRSTLNCSKEKDE